MNQVVEPAVTTIKIGSADFPTYIDVLTPFELSRPFDKGAGMKLRRLEFLGSAIISTAFLNGSASPPARPQSSQVSAVAVSLRDGSHDFDFLIGNWKAHVRVLRDRLNGSNDWAEYNGISNHKKLLDSNANFEEFDAYSDQLHKRNKGQTLRLYNPETHQWSIYLLDLDKGTLDLPPVVGQFAENRGEFYNQDTYKGRAIYVRYVWLNISPKSARMEQSWSADGGRTWEVNWICELSR